MPEAGDASLGVELERSPEARELAERVLVGLLDGFGGVDTEIVVLGGLVPEVLTSGQDPPAPAHLGTTDVDVLLVTHVTLERNFGHVEEALKAMDFRPANEGWRWRGRFGGPPVKVEFLCDLESRPEFELVELSGCDRLVAQNLRGTGYVARDWSWRELEATLPDGRDVSVRARFAQLSGYLLSKLVAARTRGADKDFYDLAYVLLHNRAGGPAAAAHTVGAGTLRDALPALQSTVLEIAERYRTPNAIGPSGFARESLRAAPDANEAELKADAVAAIGEFLAILADQPADES